MNINLKIEAKRYCSPSFVFSMVSKMDKGLSRLYCYNQNILFFERFQMNAFPMLKCSKKIKKGIVKW
jgi:hypothetical protein